jgi:hypothetical protein
MSSLKMKSGPDTRKAILFVLCLDVSLDIFISCPHAAACGKKVIRLFSLNVGIRILRQG